MITKLDRYHSGRRFSPDLGRNLSSLFSGVKNKRPNCQWQSGNGKVLLELCDSNGT